MASNIRDLFPFGDIDRQVVEGAAERYPGMVDPSMAVVFDLGRAAVRMLEDASSILEQHGLTPARWRVIVALLFQSGQEGATMGGLAGHLGVREPTVTTTVKRMEEEGLVRRLPDRSDGRVTRVLLTDRGAGLAAEVVPKLAARLRGFMAAMGGPEAVEETASLINRACDALGDEGV